MSFVVPFISTKKISKGIQNGTVNAMIHLKVVRRRGLGVGLALETHFFFLHSSASFSLILIVWRGIFNQRLTLMFIRCVPVPKSKR